MSTHPIPSPANDPTDSLRWERVDYLKRLCARFLREPEGVTDDGTTLSLVFTPDLTGPQTATLNRLIAMSGLLRITPSEWAAIEGDIENGRASMIPVRTAASNLLYLGPSPDVGNAWAERKVPGAVMLTWKPSEEERALILGGALIELGIYGIEPIPPVSLEVSTRRELSAAAAALRDQAIAELRRLGIPGPSKIPPGYWAVSAQLWGAFVNEGALDPDDGVPTLLGRPLMAMEDADPGLLVYNTLPQGERA